MTSRGTTTAAAMLPPEIPSSSATSPIAHGTQRVRFESTQVPDGQAVQFASDPLLTVWGGQETQAEPQSELRPVPSAHAQELQPANVKVPLAEQLMLAIPVKPVAQDTAQEADKYGDDPEQATEYSLWGEIAHLIRGAQPESTKVPPVVEQLATTGPTAP